MLRNEPESKIDSAFRGPCFENRVFVKLLTRPTHDCNVSCLQEDIEFLSSGALAQAEMSRGAEGEGDDDDGMLVTCLE